MGELAQSTKKFTWEEVRKHNTPDDAYMVYDGKIYNVSGWAAHPGGNVIFSHAGDDFTDIFGAFHPKSAYSKLDKFYIGQLELSSDWRSDQQRVVERAYRELRSKLIMAGMFDSNVWYYVYKVFSGLLILAASVACVVAFSSLTMHILGACLLGLFWQQSGWLAHDFLHHQVFKDRFYGDLMGFFIGNVCQGFSVSWWKDKHNTHHAVPNLHESDADTHDGDPDIDTMPLLAWSLAMAQRIKQTDTTGKFFIKYQAIFYFPLLLLARVAWLNSSWLFVFGWSALAWNTKHIESSRGFIKHPRMEKATLTLYHLWNVVLLLQMPWFHALIFFAVAQTSCGLMLALVFGLGHNGMTTYKADERPVFINLQVTTTRNITGNWLVHWFCGGLQYQVDHHLFPSLPRHNFGKVHEHVERFCKDHGVRYHEAGVWDGTVEVLNHLSKVSNDFITHFPAV